MASFKVYTPPEKIKAIYGSGTIEPPKFMPTYYEWLRSQGQDIIKVGEINFITPTTALYTVPSDKVFFLTGIYVSIADGGDGGSEMRLEISGCSLFPTVTQLFWYFSDLFVGPFVDYKNFSTPLRFLDGTFTINSWALVATQAFFVFSGFEVPKYLL